MYTRNKNNETIPRKGYGIIPGGGYARNNESKPIKTGIEIAIKAKLTHNIKK